MPVIDISASLARCGLFRGFDDARLNVLAEAAENVNFAKGIDILCEGDPGDAMYVVLSGAVQVYTQNQEGREIVLVRLEAGDFFGEQALLPGGTGRRNASVRAAEPSVVARIPKAAFQSALAQDDALRERLLKIGAGQVRNNLQELSPLARGIGFDSAGTLARTLATGEILFRQGDEADALYFVAAGRLGAWREENGNRTLIGTIDRGGCVGELALIRKDRRAATIIAEELSEVLAVPRAAFEEAFRESAALREHLSTLQRAYEFPQRGIVTQHAGTFAGHECVTTLYHLQDGRVFAAYRVIGESLYAVERLGTSSADVLSWEVQGRSRELRVDTDGTVTGLTARGEWMDVHMFHLFVLDGGRINEAQRKDFTQSGWFDLGAAGAPADMVCHCVNVSGDKIRKAIAQGATTFTRVQQATGCGTVCGGCIPAVAEMLGSEEWVWADIVAEQEEVPGIRSFELVPRENSYPDAQPGQHVVVEGLVSGMRVRRPYTLSSAASHGGRLRITVKREEQGALSRWLFDQREKDRPIRITRPRGEYVVRLSANPVICLVAGIGVTPAVAAVRTAASTNRSAPLFIHYSGHERDRMALIKELEAASGPNIQLSVRETARDGRIDMAEVAGIARRFPNADWYLCGPQAYLDQAAAYIRKAKVPDSMIHIEAFTAVGTPAITTEERAAVRRYLLATPEPPAKQHLVMTLRRIGRIVWRFANSRIPNPLQWLEHRIGRAARVDPALPMEHLAIVSALSCGPYEFPLNAFRRWEGRPAQRRLHNGKGKLPPNTPDGDTVSYWIPNAPFPTFPKACAVDTGWSTMGSGWFVPSYITRSRTAIDHLLRQTEHSDRGAFPYHFLQQVVGRMDIPACPGRKAAGLFAGQLHDNATWSEDRELTKDALAFPSIDQFTAGMVAAIQEVCTSIDEVLAEDPEKVIDLNVMLSRLAYTVVIRAVLGNVDLTEMTELGRSLLDSIRLLFNYLYKFVNGLRTIPMDYIDAHRNSRETITKMIELLQHLDEAGKLSETQRASPLVRVILKTAAEPGGKERLFAFMLPVIVAGHESTGHMMTWAIYHMGLNPDLERVFVDEITTFRAAHGGEVLTTAEYDERPVTLALQAECLRRYPPVYVVPRSPLEDGEVPPDPETGIGGFKYPAGAMVSFCIHAIHMDPDRWPDPYAFRIERWMEGIRNNMSTAEKGKIVRNNMRMREEALDWMPFAAGPGRCPGQHFNTHEFLLVLETLVARYHFELVDPHRKVVESESVVSGPEPGSVGVRIRKRETKPI